MKAELFQPFRKLLLGFCSLLLVSCGEGQKLTNAAATAIQSELKEAAPLPDSEPQEQSLPEGTSQITPTSKLTSQYYTCTTDRDKSYEAFAKCKIDPSMVHMFQDARPRLYIGKESFEVSMTHPTSSDDATYFELYLPFWIVDDLDDSHIVFE